MITGTTLAVFFVPVFFVLVRGLFKGSARQQRLHDQRAAEAAQAAAGQGGSHA